MRMITGTLPNLKEFLKPLKLKTTREALVIRMIMAFIFHPRRMSATAASEIVAGAPLHRAQITRFLGRDYGHSLEILRNRRTVLLAYSAPPGTYLFIVDQTYCSQQGQWAQNTFRMGAKSSRNKSKKKKCKSGYVLAQRQVHCFMMGLLITPQGSRIPFVKHYYTEACCKEKKRPFYRQTKLAAALLRELPLPAGTDVVVLGDTAFDAEAIQTACAERGYTWIVPMNPERVLSGPKPRPKVSSLASEFSADQFTPVELHSGSGQFAIQRRASKYRVGRKAKSRIFYAHQETRDVQSVGTVRLVFSTRTRPKPGKTVDVQKILMSNDTTRSVAQIVELYDLRWQIELFFKELKSTLGLDQYRFQEFQRVEMWVELALVTFLYLEWFRADRMRRRGLTRAGRQWWQRQRTYGMCRAVQQIAERDELRMLAKHLRTPRGIRKIQEFLENANQKESPCRFDRRHAAGR